MPSRNTRRGGLEFPEQSEQSEQSPQGEAFAFTTPVFTMSGFTEEQNNHLEQLMQRVAQLAVQSYKTNVATVAAIVTNPPTTTNVVPTVERPSIEILNGNGNANSSASKQPSKQPIIAPAKRYKIEDIEYFDPETNAKNSTTSDVYIFTDRIKEVANLKGARLVQLNIRQNLQKVVANWHDYELMASKRKSFVTLL